MAMTAAQILKSVADQQHDLWVEGLEGCPPDLAAELARRFRLAVERGYVVVDDYGIMRLTSAAVDYLAVAP